MAGAATQTQRDLKFVGSDPAGLPLKRKQVQQACDSCRRKKKRCVHTRESAGSNISQDHPDIDAIAASQLLHFSCNERLSTPQRSEEETATFIGDLNPESVLIQAATCDTDRPNLDSSMLGVWYRPQQPSSQVESPAKRNKTKKARRDMQGRTLDDTKDGATAPTGDMSGVQSGAIDDANFAESDQATHQANGSPLESRMDDSGAQATAPASLDDPCHCTPTESRVRDCHACLQRLIERASRCSVECVARDVLPHAASWRGIKRVYFTKIHPILPIFDESRLQSIADPQSARLSRIEQLVVVSVCHAVSFDPIASSYFQFSSKAKAAPYQSKMIGLAKELAKVLDKKKHMFDYLRATTLLCYFWQVDSSTPQEPIEAFAEVMLLIQTHGLHLGRLRVWDIQTWVSRGFANPPDSNSFATLFSCIISLDRLNAAYYGRPVLCNEHDLVSTKSVWGTQVLGESGAPDAVQGDQDVGRTESGETGPSTPSKSQQPPTFRLYMSIIFYLDQVIELYRPNPKWREVIPPVFEQLIVEAGAENEPTPILATLELLYHAVSTSSVRMTHSLFVEPPETNDTTERRGPGSKHLPSPNLNARRSLSTDRILWIVHTYPQISVLPFIPYALSLALSVAYRKWRFSKIAMFRSRGRATFTEVGAALARWSHFSCAARNMRLAETVIRKMKETEEKVSKQAPPKIEANDADAGERGHMGGDKLPSTSVLQIDYGVGNPSSQPETPALKEGVHQVHAGVPPSSDRQYMWTPILDQSMATPSTTYRPERAIQAEEQDSQQTPAAARHSGQELGSYLPVSTSMLQESPGIDVFRYVDKGTFPQGTVDFAFYSNLDPTCPSNGWLDFDPWDIDMDLARSMEIDGWSFKRW